MAFFLNCPPENAGEVCRLFPRFGAQSKHEQGPEDGYFLFPARWPRFTGLFLLFFAKKSGYPHPPPPKQNNTLTLKTKKKTKKKKKKK